jgi:hypothetical protein
MTRRSIALLTLAVAFVPADPLLAQGTFPAPLPGQAIVPPSDSCSSGFSPLREEAGRRGQLIKEARDRYAPPDETCKLIGDYIQAEVKMLRYVEANSAKCAIPGRIADQLKAGHKQTETLLVQVCTAAARTRGQKPAGPAQINDFGDPAFGRAPRF